MPFTEAPAELNLDFLDSLFRGTSLLPKILSGEVKLEGDRAAMGRMTGWFDVFPTDFPIVTRPD